MSDREALEYFRSQWTLYSKQVRHNPMFHHKGREQLRRDFRGPIRVLDLACGDASVELPEAVSDMLALGYEAGFSGAEQRIVSPTGIYRMFVYWP